MYKQWMGRTWKELLADVELTNSDCIRSLNNPITTEPGLKILYGNLSPTGSIVRPTGVPKEMKQFSGKAKIHINDQDAFLAIERGDILPGDVVMKVL